jgi:hypothetical protein
VFHGSALPWGQHFEQSNRKESQSDLLQISTPPLGVFPLARLLKLLLEPGQASLQTVAGKLCGSDRSTHLCSLNYDGWIESLLTRFSSRRVGFLRSSLDFLK